MKLIKKIAAIMFAFMMVFTLSSNVNAETVSGDSTQTGTITITNAKKDHTYKLYKILNLDSYSYDSTSANRDGNYSYTLTGDASWDAFVNKNKNAEGENDKFFNVTDNKYVTFNKTKEASDLAKAAMKYVTDENVTTTTELTKTATEDGNLEFTGLKLGYYLVDSTAGALCNLTTTNPTINIQEKSEVPKVEKQVWCNDQNKYSNGNYASIGDTVKFKTTITKKSGAQNYILHDTLSNGLTLSNSSFSVKKSDGTDVPENKYKITYNDKLGDDAVNCSFHISFENSYIEALTDNEKIEVEYSAVLNEKAVIFDPTNGGTNDNTTFLQYGDNMKTTVSTTNTMTYYFKVFKYTGSNKPLADAEFELTQNGNKIKFVLDSTKDGMYKVYRKATQEEIEANKATDKLITDSDGKIKICGIFGEYKLEETKAPKGYNKLVSPYTIKVSDGGFVTVNNEKPSHNDVKVKNESGSLLPSTGGMGTTLIYLIGGVLVLGSGVVLMNKKRAKAK
ncbi:SpaA isopeptide-forming pilin-related protein [Holdemanella biformis]|uniref:SpaA isopeptide-forming pilin-related protein n=2 Tax=Holdemanella biformis TaxID=1735 RepID=UPI0022DF833A|nr:SpaA isopeptide-forming pilin-related protein [Holdemanella biformis]